MARKADQMNGDAQTPRPGHNGYDPEKVKGVIEEIEDAEARIEQINQEARNKCEPIRDEIKLIKDRAKDQYGIPKGDIAHVLRERKLRKKLERIDDDLDQEDEDRIDQLRHALGMLSDLPLGDAAVKKAEGAGAAR